MRPTETPSWVRDARLLRRWFYVYLALWLPGAALFVAALATSSSTWVALRLVNGSIFPYLASLFYAYRVMRDLHAARLGPDGPWAVVLSAVVFNPFLLGFVIPLWVLRDVRRAMQALATGSNIQADA